MLTPSIIGLTPRSAQVWQAMKTIFLLPNTRLVINHLKHLGR
jgi:hypothetical protein